MAVLCSDWLLGRFPLPLFPAAYFLRECRGHDRVAIGGGISMYIHLARHRNLKDTDLCRKDTRACNLFAFKTAG